MTDAAPNVAKNIVLTPLSAGHPFGVKLSARGQRLDGAIYSSGALVSSINERNGRDLPAARSRNVWPSVQWEKLCSVKKNRRFTLP